MSQIIPSICSLCGRPMQSTGEHQICSISCGHMFGYNCIFHRYTFENSCPICNAVIHQKDIRLLFFDNPIPIDEKTFGTPTDTSSLVQIRDSTSESLRSVRESINNLQMQYARCNQENHAREKQIIYQQGYPAIFYEANVTEASRCLIHNNKIIWSSKNEIGFGLNIANIEIPEDAGFVNLFDAQIRDISAMDEMIAAVSFDRSFAVLSLKDNEVIYKTKLECQLWCCTFATESILILGGEHGRIIAFDFFNEKKIFELESRGPPVMSIDMIANDIAFVANGRIGFAFDLRTQRPVPGNRVIADAVSIKSSKTRALSIVLTRRDGESHLFVCNTSSDALSVKHNVLLPSFNRLYRPGIAEVPGIATYFSVIGSGEKDAALFKTADPRTDVMMKWRNRFTPLEKPVIDVSLGLSDEVILAVLTSDTLRIYSFPP